MLSILKGFKLWEIALAAGLIGTLLFGFWAQNEQGELAERLLRMHVVANSDADFDQELKLKVRDAALAAAKPLTDGAENAKSAAATLDLPLIERAARDALQDLGYDYTVRVTIAEEEFPTREYDGFSLPAGRYTALRIVIGEGAGRNWWCVVFPPLCDAASRGKLESAGLSEKEVALIADNGGVKLKFKCVEWWEKLRQCLK
ncbi:stage II sporulation protein R [Clostridia bacterium]|nr:stage II sporulation protein R [Clostridia bacterium]